MSAVAAFADDLLYGMAVRSPDLAAELGLRTVGGRALPQDNLPGFDDEAANARNAFMAERRVAFAKLGPDQDPGDAETRASVDFLLESGWFGGFAGRQGQGFVTQPYPVNHLNGAHPVLTLMLTRDHAIGGQEDAENYLSRLEALGPAIDGATRAQHARNAEGIKPPAHSLAKALDDLRAFVAPSADENLLARKLPDDARAARIVEITVLPAYHRLIEAAQAAPGGGELGFGALPNGEAHYAWRLAAHTTRDLSPDQVARIGLEETARVQDDIRALFAGLGYEGGDLSDLYARMEADPALQFPTGPQHRDSVWRDAETLARDLERTARPMFRLWPTATMDIQAIPAELEGSMHTHYTPPDRDAGRPGRFSLNIAAMQGRPRAELAVLCCHEGAPGHHTQLALAQELAGLPDFRRAVVFTAYIEGWAKYAETLLDHDLMDDPYVRLGRLRGELYSSVNLVLDTGVHARGWTRDRAARFFREQTGVGADFAKAIADRSLVEPGQMTAYKIGMLTMRDLRARLERARGPTFDIRDFHDLALGHGALPLAVLENVVDRACALETAL
jgi:uncharacterized protein (DUF885 family)